MQRRLGRETRTAAGARVRRDDARHERAVPDVVLGTLLVRPVGHLLHVSQAVASPRQARVEDSDVHALPVVPQSPQGLRVQPRRHLRRRRRRHGLCRVEQPAAGSATTVSSCRAHVPRGVHAGRLRAL
eukprot:409233-Prymnesium_polylepis.2